MELRVCIHRDRYYLLTYASFHVYKHKKVAKIYADERGIELRVRRERY
jgi:hypothetical protein